MNTIRRPSFYIKYRFTCNQAPDNGLSQLPDRLLLFRHDYSSSNVLHIVSNTADIADETVIEIVLTASRK